MKKIFFIFLCLTSLINMCMDNLTASFDDLEMSDRDKLLSAVDKSNYNEVLKLLDQGVPINFFDEYPVPFTPLHYAVCRDSQEIFDLLLERGATVNVQIPTTGSTPLHSAVRTSRMGFVQELLKRGAQPELCDYNGNTVLHTAAGSADSTIVELLIKRGVNVNSRNKQGVTPLHYAVRFCQTNAVDALDIITILLDHGANVNIPTIELEETPLHYLAKESSRDKDLAIKAAQLLIDKGALINPRNSGGVLPLHYAVEQGKIALVNLLISKRAHIGAYTDSGINPLDIARNNKDLEMETLIQNKAKLISSFGHFLFDSH